MNIRIKEQGVCVRIDAKARNYIVNYGFSEEYGASHLRRIVQDELESAVATYILRDGADKISGKKKGQKIYITTTVKGDKLVLSDKKK